ncbi:MAG: dephospho-CoA kinase [Chloroflexota bacterium]
MGRFSEGTSPRILGLTGPIGCGKTTVGNILLELGAIHRIDADSIVHELLDGNLQVSREVEQAFGPPVMTANGAVDRSRLARIVFSNHQSLRTLEDILHPRVRAEVRNRLRSFRGTAGVIALDAVKLLQSDLLELTDAVWLVCCGQNVQIDRLTRQRHMNIQDVESRLSAQPSFDSSRITTIIENSGTEEDLYRRVEGAWALTVASWGSGV